MFLYVRRVLCVLIICIATSAFGASSSHQVTRTRPRLKLRELRAEQARLGGAIDGRTQCIAAHALAGCSCGAGKAEVKRAEDDLEKSNQLNAEYWKRRNASEDKQRIRRQRFERCAYWFCGTVAIVAFIAIAIDTYKMNKKK